MSSNYAHALVGYCIIQYAKTLLPMTSGLGGVVIDGNIYKYISPKFFRSARKVATLHSAIVNNVSASLRLASPINRKHIATG